MLCVFIQSVASALIYAVVCWGTWIRVGDANWLNKLIRKTGSVIGVDFEPLEFVSERRMISQLLTIMDNMSNPVLLEWGDCSTEGLSCFSAKGSAKDSHPCLLPKDCTMLPSHTVALWAWTWMWTLVSSRASFNRLLYQVLTKHDSASFQWQVIFQMSCGG